MLSKKVSLCLAVIALLAGSAVWAEHHEEGFAGMGKAWEAAYNSGDLAAVASMYLEDGMRMPPGMPIVTGREAIQAQIQQGVDRGLAKVKIETVESHEVMGEWGFARGTFTAMDAEGNTLGNGKWVNVSKHVDGKWFTHFDIWNYDAPLPASE